MTSQSTQSVSTARKLKVFINTAHVGDVRENNGLWQFQYIASWLTHAHAFPLAPYLPLQAEVHSDTGTNRPVQWFFDNLLPEEMARQLLAKDLKVGVEDAFGMLEAIGGETAGALTLLPPGIDIPNGDIALLSNDELSKRIKNLPRSPMNNRQRKRMSLAGAQHKMLVVQQQHKLYEPIGQMPSTHILKPEHSQPDIYHFTVRNEYTTMTLARACGLVVPKVAIDYVPEAYYLVERFDRIGQFPEMQRIHVLDGCQLLGLSAGAKYRMNTIDTLLQLKEMCRSKGLTALRLFRWVLFNFFTGNGDAHLKNLSFSYQQGDLELLPHYDLLSTIIYADVGESLNQELSQPLGNATYFGQVTHADLIQVAEQFNLKPQIAEREITQLKAKLITAMDNELARIEQSTIYSGKAGELRMLRQIQHLAIRPLTEQV